MANAGCINAIWFDWTYLRTLDTLDSANIGVGVQYCIPAPLDDKRLDYIKYTDKCGCTCCITGENEILVYATNWVIKNFTLTNDDTNEVVNVKWNDLFGSNRAYTMVRYKTWSYPTSISDWTLAVKETTQNQYSVSWYNVSGLTNWTTYYFTAFAVSQDGTIIVVQNKTITAEFGWHPNTNTLAYWKLEWDLLDYSWNNRTLTNAWALTFQTVDWITAAWCEWSTYWNWYAYTTQLPTVNQLTVNIRAKAQTWRSWTYARWLFHTHFNYSNWNDWVRREMYSWNAIPCINVWNGSNFNSLNYTWVPYGDLTKWNMRTITWNNSTHVACIYLNWVLYWTQTFSNYIPSWNRMQNFSLWIWYKSNDNITRRRYWRISQSIVEKVIWTQEDIQKYYLKTSPTYQEQFDKFQEVEYIRSGWSCKISTSVMANSQNRIQSKFLLHTSVPTSWEYILYWTTNTWRNWNAILAYYRNWDLFEAWAWNNPLWTTFSLPLNTQHTIDMTMSNVIIDWVSHTYSWSTANYEITLFYWNSKWWYMTAYYYKI